MERDSKSPYRVLASGESNDAHHATAPHPEGLVARLAMERALSAADLRWADLGYLNAHGTGTVKNDAMESKAISQLNHENFKIAFSSTKDRTGHQLGAAGASEAIFCLKALEQEYLPPNASLGNQSNALPAQPQLEEKGKLGQKIVMSNSFAFGGNNIALILGISEPSPT